MFKIDKILNNLVNCKNTFNDMEKGNRLYEFYGKAKKELGELNINQLSISNINSVLRNSLLIVEYLKSMNDFDLNILYQSDIHGVYHNIRVSLYILIISTIEKLSTNDFRIVIDAAKYHDIGRINDLEDKEHGKNSSKKIQFLKEKYSNEDYNILKTIIECHCLNDNMFVEIANKNNVSDIERGKILLNVLKDSDGLDRVRLEYPYININLLRTSSAKRLIIYSYQIYNNFKEIMEANNE